MSVPSAPRTESLPREARRWNWGAFLLSWIWGIGNNTFIALLALIPLVGIVMPFVLGAKGNAWAWRNARWDSVDHFRRVQRRWALWGVTIWLAFILCAGGSIGAFLYYFSHSEPYLLATAQLDASAEMAQAFGRPIKTGFPLGNITVDQSGGRAALSFSVSGPKATGRAQVGAVKENGGWALKVLRVTIDGSSVVLDLLNSIHAHVGPPLPATTL